MQYFQLRFAVERAAGGIWSAWLQLTRAPWKTRLLINGTLLESSQCSLSALQFPLNYPDHVILCNLQNLIAFKAFSQYLFITLLIGVFGFQPNGIYRWVVNSGNSLGLGLQLPLPYPPPLPQPPPALPSDHTYGCCVVLGVESNQWVMGRGCFNTHLLVQPSYSRGPLKVQGSVGHQSHESPSKNK